MKRMVCLVALLITATGARGQGVRKAPSLTLKSIEGRGLRLSDYKGKVVLLNFWATWCPPCRAEMPDLVKMQRDYAERGLQVIGVTYPPETIREVRRFAGSLGVNYPVALGAKATRSLFAQTETLPVTVVIDRDGNIRDTIEGILLPEEFEQKIKPLLKQPASVVKMLTGITDRGTHQPAKNRRRRKCGETKSRR
jgi:thiol-disulfide isomerase/thioredoxin